MSTQGRRGMTLGASLNCIVLCHRLPVLRCISRHHRLCILLCTQQVHYSMLDTMCTQEVSNISPFLMQFSWAFFCFFVAEQACQGEAEMEFWQVYTHRLCKSTSKTGVSVGEKFHSSGKEAEQACPCHSCCNSSGSRSGRGGCPCRSRGCALDWKHIGCSTILL